MRRYLAPILVVLLALAALILSSGGPGGQSAHAATAVAVGIDADPSGNTATTLGTIDTCREVTAGDVFTVDLFVQGVSGGITGFDITIHSNPGALRTLPPPQGAYPDVDMLLAEVGYVVDFSDIPDVTDNDGFYAVRAADPGGATTAENGDGVLARVTLKAVANGKSALHLTVPNISPILTGGDGNPIEPTDGPFGVFVGSVFGAQIYVGQSCPGTNNPPNADAKVVGATEDTPLVVTLTGSDPEGLCPLTFAALPGASNGTLGSMGIPSCTPTPNSASTTVTFVPAADVCAPQQGSFQYTVSDGVQTSSAATVTVNITCVNDEPSAANMAVSTIVNNPVTITVTATDIENDCPLTFALGSMPSDGILGSFTNVTCTADTPTTGTSTGTADITYTPDTDYKGPDSFTFTAADPEPLVSDLGTVSINVTPVSADDKSESTPEDPVSPLTVTLSATDVENNCPLDFAIDSGPSNGGLGSITNVTCTPDTPIAGTSTATADVDYTPDLNYNGSDSFSYTASNQVVPPDTSNIATVSITVTPVNDPPQADDKSAFTGATDPVTVTLSATDVDNDCPLSFSIVAPPGDGSLGAIGPVTCTPDTPSSGTSTSTADVEYTPDLAFSGIDTFTYKATDPSVADSNIATVSITVASADADSDGLLDMFEASNDCVDTDPDTDDDGLTDGQEVILLGTLCDEADTDGDTSTDALEMTLTGSVTSATSTTLVDDDSSYPQPPASPDSFWATDQWTGFFVTITGGTGAGQTRQITGNTADTLAVDPAWSSTPDGTSTYAIHKVETLPLVACAADATPDNEDPDPQPADLNDDRDVNVLDTFKLFPGWLTGFGDPGYDTRLDLNADGDINVLDTFELFPVWLTTCTP